ncbi:MAG: helix-turn-helix domain-containing protein [Pseudomonadota bacterium]
MVEKVADFIVRRQAEIDVTNRELADAVGYHNPNVITMIRKGRTKLPVDKVQQFATALGVDPVWLLRHVMQEYMPETLKVVEQCIGPLTTNNERCVLEVWRHATDGNDPEIRSELRKGIVQILKLGSSSAL